MKQYIYNTIFFIAVFAFKVQAAYNPHVLNSMTSPNSTLTVSHVNGICSCDVSSSKVAIWDSAYTYRAKFYNSDGRLFIVPKIWTGVVNITDATQQSIDISSAGFSTVAFIGVGVIDDIPTNIIVRSNTTSAIVLDSYQLASTGVSILPIPVIQTITMGVATNLTGLQASVTVFGY